MEMVDLVVCVFKCCFVLISECFNSSQGTFVEGIKEEVVLSPAHALSLIAAGEGILLCC